MPRVPVKLTKNEIVLPPRVSQMHRARLEEMNQQGLIARNMGGVASYRANGGSVSYLQNGTPPAAAPAAAAPAQPGLGQQLHQGLASPAAGQLGKFLYKSAFNDPNAIDAFDGSGEGSQKELKTAEDRVQALKESIDAAAKATQYIDLGAGIVLDHIAKSWSGILSDGSWTDYIAKITTATTGWITGQERKAVDNAAHEIFAGSKEWNAYKLFTQEVKLLQLKARALVKGGSISDAEAQAASETIITDYTDAETTKQQLATVIERSNQSISVNGGDTYTSAAIATEPTGDDYEPLEKDPNAGKLKDYKPIEIEPAAVALGQVFKDDSDYLYEVKPDEDHVTVIGGSYYDGTEYELFYAETEKKYFVEGTTGQIILTPVEKMEVDNGKGSKQSNGSLVDF